MKPLRNILISAGLLLMVAIAASCQKEEYPGPVEATLEIEDLVVVEAVGGQISIPLVSSYPWIASTNASWIKMVKKRGQMKLQEKIIIEVQPNMTDAVRESGLQIRLMDQMSHDIIIRQKSNAAPAH